MCRAYDLRDLEVDAITRSNTSLTWGPYRPNLYVGIRPRFPESLMFGLMWANVDNYENFQDLRHTCEQGEDIKSYGWERFDPRRGGKHVVHDDKMGIDLETDFVKLSGGAHGQWALRVKGRPVQGRSKDLTTAIVLYFGLEGPGSINLSPSIRAKGTSKGIPGDVEIIGQTAELGRFSARITDAGRKNRHPRTGHSLGESRDLTRTSFLAERVAHGDIWRAKEILLQKLQEQIIQSQSLFGSNDLPDPALLFSLPNTELPQANLFYFGKTFEGAFEFDIIYQADNEVADLAPVTVSTISSAIAVLEDDHRTKFDRLFRPTEPFNDSRYVDLGKALISNLLGGIGYFYGSSIVDRSYSASYIEDTENFWENAATQLASKSGTEETPAELLTAVPSRSFFPRGFYWDEGFHLMPIGIWDQDLALEIITSWMNLMDEDGWIGREQILGAEARSKVPAEFTTQYPHYANPPTLFIAIDHFLDRVNGEAEVSRMNEYSPDFQQALGFDDTKPIGSLYLENPELARRYLVELYPKLRKHYDWFRRTQAGEIQLYDREAYSKREGYRWRGRTPEHCLTSGIDDYPRARPPHLGELHLDLHSWIGLMTRLMHKIADYVGESEDAKELQATEIGLLRNLDDLHWSEADQAYCDQTVDEYEENVPVCHLGYISIFPVLLGLLTSDHPHLGSVLRLMRNEDHLWSPYGLRSLSAQDDFYGTGENYWRGPIWININYLALSALFRYYVNVKGPHQVLAQQIYQELRTNVVDTVETEFRRTGIIWEQYDPVTGHGQRTKGFTGWTSMIVNIMAEKY